MAGQGLSAAGQGASPANGIGGWHPTILYLLALLVVEFVVWAVLVKYI